MRASIIFIPVVRGVRLQALVVEPDSRPATAPVLLFLHGKAEAGSAPNDLPLVCKHQTPPFQAMLGRLPGTLVIAPQALPLPNEDGWNWREYVKALAGFLTGRFGRRRRVATVFSRGGLGVLQLVSAYPDSVEAWAAVDPQPARDAREAEAILMSPALDARGWLRYGNYRKRKTWKTFSALLLEKLPAGQRDCSDLDHVPLALQAYGGSRLSRDARKKNLYDSLGVTYKSA